MATMDHKGFGFWTWVGRGVDPWGTQAIDWVMDHGQQLCSVWWRGQVGHGSNGERKKQKIK